MGMTDSEILEAWTKALKDAQPEAGPLTEKTVSEVGPPPALVGGRIVTVGDLRYSSGSAFTKAFLGQTLKYRANSAGAKLYEAQKERDDPKAMKYLAESRFWESVIAWIEDVGPMLVRPEIPPSWLTMVDEA